jgi:hypothetical protein
VLWNGDDDTVYVDGKDTEVNPNSLLRYTLHDVKDDSNAKPDPEPDSEDGITFTLEQTNGIKKLSVKQGDFGKIEERREISYGNRCNMGQGIANKQRNGLETSFFRQKFWWHNIKKLGEVLSILFFALSMALNLTIP